MPKVQLTETRAGRVPVGMVRLADTFSQSVALQMDWYPVQVHEAIPEEKEVWVWVRPEDKRRYDGTSNIDADVDTPPRERKKRGPRKPPESPNGGEPPENDGEKVDPGPAIAVFREAVAAAGKNHAMIYNAICALMEATEFSPSEVSGALGNPGPWSYQFRPFAELTDEAFTLIFEGKLKPSASKMLGTMKDADQIACVEHIAKKGLGKFPAYEYLSGRLTQITLEDRRPACMLRGPWPGKKVVPLPEAESAPPAAPDDAEQDDEEDAPPPAAAGPAAEEEQYEEPPAPPPEPQREMPAQAPSALPAEPAPAPPPIMRKAAPIENLALLLLQAESRLDLILSIAAADFTPQLLHQLDEMRIAAITDSIGNKFAAIRRLIMVAKRHQQ